VTFSDDEHQPKVASTWIREEQVEGIDNSA